MKIYIYAESDDLQEIAEPLIENISHWVNKCDLSAQFVNDRHEDSPNEMERFWNLGLNLVPKRRSELRKALDHLYSLARLHHCDFVVGLASSSKGPAQDICYFGYDEGKPDVHEIANYLGFR